MFDLKERLGLSRGKYRLWKVEHAHQSKMELSRIFVRKVGVAAYNKVKNFFVGLYKHAEATVITVASGIGFTVLISEIPLGWLTVPAWINPEMVIPVIAVLIVILLLKSAEWRAAKRLAIV